MKVVNRQWWAYVQAPPKEFARNLHHPKILTKELAGTIQGEKTDGSSCLLAPNSNAIEGMILYYHVRIPLSCAMEVAATTQTTAGAYIACIACGAMHLGKVSCFTCSDVPLITTEAAFAGCQVGPHDTKRGLSAGSAGSVGVCG